MLPFKDISENNGAYNMDANADPIIAIRMSTGELMRFDYQAARNYDNAIRAGKVVINYHFAGHNDPVDEAKLFIAAVQPFAEGDVYCIDAELGQAKDWKQQFADYVFHQTGAHVLDYMNISTANSLRPLPDSPLWLAAPSWAFTDTIGGLDPSIVYVAQQGPIVNGVDTNMWFGTLDQLKRCGFHTAPPAPPAPEPAPVITPAPETPPPAPVESPKPIPLPNLVNNVPVPPAPVSSNWLAALVAWLRKVCRL